MCTHPNQGTGYARGSAKIVNHLVENNEVTYFAFQNFPGQSIKDRFIDPRIKFIDAIVEDPVSPKGFGDKAIVPSFENEKPDVLFLYNDLPVAVSILKMLEASSHSGYKIIVYLDLVYPWEDIERLEYLRYKVDMCYVYLNYWKTHLVDDLKWDSSKVAVLTQGVDIETFKKLDTKESKKALGFQEDDFIVLNMNRNSYRKQWYITIQAFIKFLIKTNLNPKVKLFCGCQLYTSDGFDIKKLVMTECIKYSLNDKEIFNNHIFHNPSAMFSTEEKMNLIYNACDVGLNTCCGEGFGLTNVEHGVLGKQQIVSGVPALKETLGNHAIIIEPKVTMTISNFESHGGEIMICDPDDFADALFSVYKKMDLKSHIENNYNWVNSLKMIHN